MGNMMKSKIVMGGIAALIGLFLFPAFLGVLFEATDGPFALLTNVFGASSGNAIQDNAFTPILRTIVTFVPLLLVVSGLYITGVFSWAAGAVGRRRKRSGKKRVSRVRRASAPRIVLARRR